jgi:hypothetical protein
LELRIDIQLHGSQITDPLVVIELELAQLFLLARQPPHCRLKSVVVASDVRSLRESRIA